MIEPEDVRRFERHIDAMIKKAADDPAAFAQVCDLLTRFKLSLPSAARELRRQGFSSADLGRALGVTPSSVRERFRWAAD